METEPPEVNFEWSEHMQETVILCSELSLVSTAMMRGSMRPSLMSLTPTSSSTTFLFLSSAAASADGSPPLPSAPKSLGSTGVDGAGAAAGAAGAASTGAALAGALPSMRMNLMFAPPICRWRTLTLSALLPSRAVNFPSLTVLSKNPMWPSAPKSL